MLSSLSRFLPFVALFLFPGCLTGCSSSLITNKQTDMLLGLANSAGNRLAEEKSNGQFQVGAQAINPKIRVAAGVVWFAEAGYDGVAGQLQAAAQGDLGADSNPGQTDAIKRASTLDDIDARDRAERLLNQGKAKSVKP